MTEGEESLGSSLDKQISRLNDVQQTMKGTAAELSRLKDHCVTLKQERSKLSAECAQKESDRVSLLAQVTALKHERDALRQDVEGSLGDTSHIAASTSSLSMDAQGKLKRKLWAEEQKNAELGQKIKDMEGEKVSAVEHERGIARGLRSRIGELEEKIRIGLSDTETAEKDRSDLEKRSKEESAHLEALLRQKTTEMDEMRVSLREANQRINKLVEEKDELAAKIVDAESKVKIEVTTPRKALQPRPANSIVLTRPQSPVTPSKTKGKHTPPTSPSRFSPTTGLAKRYAHLEAQHEALRAEYAKLQERYAADLRHWKEYKALELARREVKMKRKADRKEAEGKLKAKEGVASASRSLAAPGASSRPISSGIRPAVDPRIEPDHGPVDRATESPLPSQESGKLVSASEDSQALSQPVKGNPAPNDVAEPEATDNDDPLEADYESETENELFPLPQVSKTGALPSTRSITLLRQEASGHPVGGDRTLRARPSPTKKRLEEMLKEGKWLGGDGDRTPTSKQSSFKARRPVRSNTPDEQIFAKDYAVTGSYSQDPSNALHTPLIRDRGAGPSSSRRTVAQEFTVKRKRGDLEGLTPSQKTRELKRLSSLTGVEKREYYAEYKGKGRYVPPENVESRVEDEYEIDPKQNEGANFQFHDVKRRKVDRQKMHGTDCECCREYYEAVGPLPKFNEGPKWRDEPKGGERPSDDVRNHQNKVSRHRETWQRNPTPPGYWEIGFPSTQKAEEQNAIADEMNKQRARQLRQEAEQKDGKWRKRKPGQ